MTEISKYTTRISRELLLVRCSNPPIPNGLMRAARTFIAVGADGLFSVTEDAYTALHAYAEAQVAFKLIPWE